MYRRRAEGRKQKAEVPLPDFCLRPSAFCLIIHEHMQIRDLFRTKNLDDLVAETQEEGHQLKKALGPWNLIALGIGAVIGAGIFATIGTAAAGDGQRPGAGPAPRLSFVLTALVCAFSALCYADFPAMVPVAGTAFT